MAHSIFRHLAAHYDIEPHVITTRAPRRKDRLDGIPIEMVRDPNRLGVFYNWADVVVTHLDATGTAMRTARIRGKPLVHLLHNDQQLKFWKVLPTSAQLVVSNSQWIDDVVAAAGYAERLVVFPPVWVDDYQLGAIEPPTEPCVALLNLTEAKGAPTFYRVARLLPDVRFLGVQGSYGLQISQPTDLGNVNVIRNQTDVRKVYRQASVVLMPSTYESWGRVAVEAGAAGRPVIAAPTPGLRETQIPWRFVRHDRFKEWAEAIRTLLDDRSTWMRAARAAHERSRELEAISRGQLDVLAARLFELRDWEAPPSRRLPARRVH